MAKIGSFITGAAIGALAALLLAPKSGEEMRTLVTEKAGAAVDEAKDLGSSIPGMAQDALNSVKGVATKDGVADAKPADTDSDELRKKIEEARQRIAAQVMENAEQDKAIEADAETVTDAAAEVAETAKHAAAEKVEEAAEAVAEAAEDAQ